MNEMIETTWSKSNSDDNSDDYGHLMGDVCNDVVMLYCCVWSLAIDVISSCVDLMPYNVCTALVGCMLMVMDYFECLDMHCLEMVGHGYAWQSHELGWCSFIGWGKYDGHGLHLKKEKIQEDGSMIYHKELGTRI